MKYKIIPFLLVSLWSANVFAYISCKDVAVKVQTASTPTFHNFHEKGVVGSTLFLDVLPSNCSSTGEVLADRIFIVIDDIDNAAGLKKLWLSMLLSAEGRNKTINISSYDRGVNSREFQVLSPYYLTVNK